VKFLAQRHATPSWVLTAFTGGLFLVILVCAAARIDPPGGLGYDEATYLVTAKALASGRGYVQESLPGSPPHIKYPPLVPVVLAMMWRLVPAFPENLLVMRALMILVGALFLWFSLSYLSRAMPGLGRFEALGIIALVGLHPSFLSATTVLESDVVYALCAIATLLCYDKFLASSRRRHFGLTLAWATLAFLTRTMGVTLFVALAAHLAWQRRFRHAWVLVGVGLANVIWWQGWTSAAAAYAHYPLEIRLQYEGYLAATVHLLHTTPNVLAKVLPMLVTNLAVILSGWFSSWILHPVQDHLLCDLPFLVVPVIAVPTLIQRLVQRPAIHDVYCLVLGLVVLVWPWPQGNRFLFGIRPLLLAYCFVGARPLLAILFRKRWSEALVQRVSRLIKTVMVSAALGCSAVSVAAYPAWSRRMEPVGQELHWLFRAIASNTPPNAIVVGWFDPVYYLFANRKAIRLSYSDPFPIFYGRKARPEFPHAQQLLAWFQQIGACYVVRENLFRGPEADSYRAFFEALQRVDSPSLQLVDSSRRARVYRISPCVEQALPAEDN